MLDLDEPANPVHGWTAVFVPSTIGDVHWGDARHTYGASGGRSVTIEHPGFVNGMAAVHWAFLRAPTRPRARASRPLCAGGRRGIVRRARTGAGRRGIGPDVRGV
jgi:hypothetical protein